MARRIRVKLSPLSSEWGAPGQVIADGAAVSFVTLGRSGSVLKPDSPTSAKITFEARFMSRVLDEEAETETRTLATLEGKLEGGKDPSERLRFEGNLGEDGVAVGLVPDAAATEPPSTDSDDEGEDKTEIRLFRFAFDPAHFAQVSAGAEPLILRVRLDPTRFHYCEISARLEIDSQAEGDTTESDVLDVLITAQNPALAPNETRRARLVGLVFDADKCFPLPQALHGVKLIVDLHNERPDDEMVIVGHAESDEVIGSPELALARARLLAAFLTNDAKPFLPWFGKDKPIRARWGTREVQLILGAVLDNGKPFFEGNPTGVTDAATKDSIKRFQKSKGLKVDALVGPKTLQSLVEAYVLIEGTTLGKDAELAVYGCQGHTDDTMTAAGLEADDRRIEAFFFDGAIKPRPQSNLLAQDTPEYPAWRAALVETRDFENHGIHTQIIDVNEQPVPEAEVTLDGPTQDKGQSDENGFVSFFGVKKGDYTISAQRTGYQIATQSLSYPTAKTDAGRPKTAIRRVRMLGMLFDADKTFLLPQALPGIKTMVDMHNAHPHAKLLAVGHAAGDEVLAGSSLALSRAQALSAYLTHDVEVWHKEFGSKRPPRSRWGTREVQIMLSAVPEGAPHYTEFPSGVTDAKTTAAVKAFQKSKGLKEDGKVGPKTMKALIDAYMALEGTTLAKGTPIVVCGCDGHVDDDPSEDAGDVDDRRVELFLFDSEIDPAPPAPVLKPGNAEFVAWRAALVETVDFENHGIHAQILDAGSRPVPQADVTLKGPVSADSKADDHGFVSFFNLVAGEYELSARRDGFQIGSQPLRYPTGKTVAGVSASKTVEKKK